LAEPIESFRFISWADTKNAHSDLAVLSRQAKALSPVFTIYPGDLEDSGFTTAGIELWRDAINGYENNRMFEITFPVRGNHDDETDDNAVGWQGYFDLTTTAERIGAINYDEFAEDLTYSFDYGNSHFIGVDVTGSVSQLSTAQINWIDQQLGQAESRGLIHAFLWFHGPIWCLDGHCDCSDSTGCVPSQASALVDVFNRHPIVSATFHGHEHVNAWVHISSARIPNVTHEFEEFVTGSAGAGLYQCKDARVDWCMDSRDGNNAHGFATIDVSGDSFTVNMYRMNYDIPVFSQTFMKGQAPTPTRVTPTSTPAPAPTD